MKEKPEPPDTSVRMACKRCGGELFETDEALSAEHGSTVWSHAEDTHCDDPTPEHSALCFCVECLGGGEEEDDGVLDPAGDDGYTSDFEDRP